MNKEHLIRSIQKLHDELVSNGKTETAKYFDEMVFRLETDADMNRFKDELQTLSRSGAIVQYANFNSCEEEYYIEMHSEVKKLLREL